MTKLEHAAAFVGQTFRSAASLRVGKILTIVVLAGVTLIGQSAPATTVSQDPWPPPGVFLPGQAGVKLPTVISQVPPQYTREAMRAQLQGAVVLSAVVREDGSVGATRLVRSLDPGLDANAISAAKLWRFQPGTKDGAPVPVLVTLDIVFRLNGVPPPPPPTPAPFTWPEGFSPNLDTSVPGPGWTDDVEETATVRLSLKFPSFWTLQKDVSQSAWLMLMANDGSSVRAFAVNRPVSFPFPLAPMPQSVLDQMGAALSKMPGLVTTTVNKVGQTTVGSQYWLWLDVTRPMDAGALPAEAQALLNLVQQNGHAIVFMTSAGKESVMVICTVLVPRGESEAAADALLRKAGADFIAVLSRMSVQVK